MENIVQIMNLLDKPRPSPTSPRRGEAKKGDAHKEGTFFQSAVGAGSKPALIAMCGDYSSGGHTAGARHAAPLQNIESLGLDREDKSKNNDYPLFFENQHRQRIFWNEY
jgi:hypothetical protein